MELTFITKRWQMDLHKSVCHRSQKREFRLLSCKSQLSRCQAKLCQPELTRSGLKSELQKCQTKLNKTNALRLKYNNVMHWQHTVKVRNLRFQQAQHRREIAKLQQNSNHSKMIKLENSRLLCSRRKDLLNISNCIYETDDNI